MSLNHKPRLCHVARGPKGYGFHLHGEKGKYGQFIRKVESDTPAELSGLKAGDRVVEVNGDNVENFSHQEVCNGFALKCTVVCVLGIVIAVTYCLL